MGNKRTRVAGVIIKDGKILLMRRIKNGEEYYVFVGGHVESGETVEDALKREIKEEVSLDIKKYEKIFELENRGEDWICYLIVEFTGKTELGGPEKERMKKSNQYYPEWWELMRATELKNLFPREAVKKLRRLPDTHPNLEYYKALPKKRMASGVLMFNENGEFLVVKPSYKDCWSIPGGIIDDNESPRQAAARETKEEVGINIIECQFLSVDYVSNETEKGESLQFIFYGGKLKPAQINKIRINNDEIVEYKFADIKEAIKLFGGPERNLVKRILHSLKAIKSKNAVYSENGEVGS